MLNYTRARARRVPRTPNMDIGSDLLADDSGLATYGTELFAYEHQAENFMLRKNNNQIHKAIEFLLFRFFLFFSPYNHIAMCR